MNPGDLTQILEMFISVSRLGQTDDDLYGSAERKKVGDSWPINGKYVEEVYRDDPKVHVENVTGETKLERVDQRATGEVQTITLHSTAKSVPPTIQGMVADEASKELDWSTEFPVDLHQQPLGDTVKIVEKFAGHFESPEEKGTKLKGTAQLNRLRKTTPIK